MELNICKLKNCQIERDGPCTKLTDPNDMYGKEVGKNTHTGMW